MKKTNKKGFTIVELVIVIAVIAILAAVLIPNISRLVKKANASADESLVRNLNTALAMDTEKHTTMSAALKAAYENGGYDVAKIVTKNDDAKILWDSVNDCFVYLNGDERVYLPNTQTEEDVKDWNFFEICNEMPTTQKYSIYANWEGTTLDATLTVGFDAGKNVFESLTFKTNEARTVIINTNGGALTVDAENATVNHYGEADSVKIEAVASASYHENGKVIGNIEIVKGRIEVGGKGEVGTIFVSSATVGVVKVDVASGAKLGAVAPTTDAAETDVQNSTSIPADAKLIEKTSINTDFAGGLGTENSPFLIATAEQFAKLNFLDYDKQAYYVKQTKDIVITGSISKFTGVYDGGNYNLTYLSNDSNEWDYIFDKINGYSEFRNIHVVMGNVAVALLHTADWKTSFGATFDNITFASTSSVAYANVNNFGFVIVSALYTDGDGTPVYTFSNITNNVNLQNEGTSTGVFVGSGPCFYVKTTVNYTNCVNNGAITGSSYVGFLYGNPSYVDSVAKTESTIRVENCKNNNILRALVETGIASFAPGSADLNEAYGSDIGGSFVVNNYLKDKTLVLNQNGTAFTINADDTSVTYKLAFEVQSIYFTKDGQPWEKSDLENNSGAFEVSNGVKYFIDLPIDTTSTGAMSTSFKAYDKKTAAEQGFNDLDFEDGFAIVKKDGTTYLIINTPESKYINSSVKLKVYAYANGEVQGIKEIK